MKKSLLIDIVIISVLLLLVFIMGYSYLTPRNTDVRDIELQTTDVRDIQLRTLEKRLYAFQRASSFNGQTFPVVESWDAVTEDVRHTTFEGKTLVIVLSRAGCNPCQIRELRNLDTLATQTRAPVSVVAVYFDDNSSGDSANRQQALLLRKTTRFRYPMWHTENSELAAFIGRGPLPMVFLLENQTIVSSFSAIPEDGAFSQSAMATLHAVLTQEPGSEQ